jgi:hypothetical protein
MAKEKQPEQEDIDIKLGDEIPFEDESSYKAEKAQPDVVDELRDLGQQFGETIRSAWNSEEKREFENEMREGVKTFTGEIGKAFDEILASDPAKKAKSEAADFKNKAESGDLAQKTRSSLSLGLRRFSEELAKMADSFTPGEKQPPPEEEVSAEE